MEGSSKRPRKAEIRLTPEQRSHLQQITRNGSSKAKRILHARVLLLADADHPQGGQTDAQISLAVGVHVKTIARIRCKFLSGGLTIAVERKPRLTPPVAPKIDGKAEASLVAICCSTPPSGQARWSLRLLTDELIKRKVVTSLCKETVRKTLKKTGCSLGV